MVDEYRPAIYHFDPNWYSNQTITFLLAPQPLQVNQQEPMVRKYYPQCWHNGRQNRGFEAVAFQNGKLYAFVQSPIRNPATLSNTALNGMQNIRIVEFDPSTETTTAQYIYILDNLAAVSLTDTRADKIGDAVAIGNGEFLALEETTTQSTAILLVIYKRKFIALAWQAPLR